MIEKIIITPFQKFVKIESLGGILLFAATIIALIWANSSFGHLYESLWRFPLSENRHVKDRYNPHMGDRFHRNFW